MRFGETETTLARPHHAEDQMNSTQSSRERAINGSIYAGLSGIRLDSDAVDFGEGVQLRRTYAHLMSPFLMAFAPARPGSQHPTPWSAASGGSAFDITAELLVPESFSPVRWGDRLNTIQWIVALLRLWASPDIVVPVLCNMSFSDAARATENSVSLVPYETGRRYFRIDVSESAGWNSDNLAWVVEHWYAAAALINEHKEFHLAVEALDQAFFIRDPGLAMVSIWGALEELFSKSKSELRFRVSALISSFLEVPGPDRISLHKRLTKLYDSRCDAAHGRSSISGASLVASMEVLRRVIIRMISDGTVPSKEQLEARLLGDADE
jgi:hypothetical protein